MFIINGTGREIINTDFVQRFCMVEKYDSTLLIASYGLDVAPVTVARYKTKKEAAEALKSLHTALCNGMNGYALPVSTSEVRPVKRAEKAETGGVSHGE